MKALLVALVIGAAPLVLGTAVQADSCGNCAVQQPDQPAIPQTPEDCAGSNCAIPVPVLQKLAGDCTSCATEQPSDEPTPAPQHAGKPTIVA
jgi:hypothetical protein